MRSLLAAGSAALFLMFAGIVVTAPTAAAEPAVPGPPYVEHAEWAHWGDLSSLRVYPTAAGRAAAAEFDNEAQGDEAWGEVLAAAPDADLPGMRQQFICHWVFAEKAQPGKTSWNLEPWRPEVGDAAMIDARCNPGGTEEPF